VSGRAGCRTAGRDGELAVRWHSRGADRLQTWMPLAPRGASDTQTCSLLASPARAGSKLARRWRASGHRIPTLADHWPGLKRCIANLQFAGTAGEAARRILHAAGTAAAVVPADCQRLRKRSSKRCASGVGLTVGRRRACRARGELSEASSCPATLSVERPVTEPAQPAGAGGGARDARPPR
jgi:hypothetical protein